MSHVPLVSIAMSVYNCQSTVAQAIRSILAQTFTDWELLIVNDGSTDDTLSVIQQFRDPRFRVWSDEVNKGRPARGNETIDQSRGMYYAVMDGDDVAYPTRIERQVAFLQANPEIDLVGAWMLVFDKEGIAIGKKGGKLGSKSLYLFCSIPIWNPTAIGKLEWFRHYRYAEHPLRFQDQHLLIRGLKTSRYAIVPELLMGYREALTLKKQLWTRWSYFQSLPQMVKEFGGWQTTVLLFSQFAKMGIDIFAIGTGLNYRLLRHRALPISQTERQDWEQLWKAVNQFEI